MRPGLESAVVEVWPVIGSMTGVVRSVEGVIRLRCVLRVSPLSLRLSLLSPLPFVCVETRALNGRYRAVRSPHRIARPPQLLPLPAVQQTWLLVCSYQRFDALPNRPPHHHNQNRRLRRNRHIRTDQTS